MSRKNVKKISHGKKYIKFKASGKMIIKAKTREEAIEKAKQRFEKYLQEVDEDNSFPNTGLDEWLKDEVDMLLGLEEPKETDKRGEDEEMSIRWTNYKEEGERNVFPKGRRLR